MSNRTIKTARNMELLPHPSASVSPDDIFPLASEVIFARTRYGKDGQVEYRDRDGGWTPHIHQAYVIPACDSNKKSIGYFRALDASMGGNLSRVSISVYDKAAPKPKTTIAPIKHRILVVGEWRDCVTIVRPMDRNDKAIKADPLFLCHHGVYEDKTVLTQMPSRAVVCVAGMTSQTDIDRLDYGVGTLRLPGWYNRHHMDDRPAHRVISIVSGVTL